MSIYMSRLFPRSNSSLFLTSGKALQSQVLRLGEEKFLVDAGPGTPRICLKDELTRVPTNRSITRFENKVGSMDLVAGGESPQIRKKILERFFIDLVAGESLIKERAAARFNDLVGSEITDDDLLLPRRFRQNRAWMELNKIWRTNTKVKGFIIDKVRGGYAVAIAGFVTFLPLRYHRRKRSLSSNDRFTIESINPKRSNIVVF
ncbi:small ribosomal subunit protein bS1m-like [Gastrolobium bilobum]|uniref:small ribosomal subunit protein bS1m-like n=1 Tax=Gastrolobium bilobum TaxID=150636 RepID=UPI002AB260B0|nr:small ribosomal subunit protein bS1m-like [Gastrolobium bilobum]